MLVDSHCHLYLDNLKTDLEAVLERSRRAGVERVICVGIDLETSAQCLELAETHSQVFATAGIHPHEAGRAGNGYLARLAEFLDHPRMVAVGEMGLDYYRNYSPREAQKRVFREQLELARDLDKPVVFHNRQADEDLLSCLDTVGHFRGVAHCFSSSAATARAFIDRGLYVSFAGNLTFPKSSLPAVARSLPLVRILVETDAPYLSPVPHRGRTNEPGRTRLVAGTLARIRSLPFQQVAEATRRNTEALFGLPPI